MNDSIINTHGEFKTGKRSGFAALFIARDIAGRCYRAANATTDDSVNDSGGRMDVSKMDSMLAQLRAGAALAAGKPAQLAAPGIASPGVNETGGGQGGGGVGGAGGVGIDFTSVLKKSLDQVNHTQQHAAKLTRDFEVGAPGANLTDAMISLQKANISLQYTLQVRNKIVAAYQDIMNMPV
jgi:flagellar hook-basal body complex protein FliE